MPERAEECDRGHELLALACQESDGSLATVSPTCPCGASDWLWLREPVAFDQHPVKETCAPKRDVPPTRDGLTCGLSFNHRFSR